MRRRLDVELVRRGFVPSRSRAADVIAAGRVMVAGVPATTAARRVDGAEPIALAPEVAGETWVSRGGAKLAGALDELGVAVEGRWAADFGASTGGFTDCLLRRGAAHVYAVDVGRGQLAWSLRNDPRVTVMERTNVRDLATGALDPAPDLCVADLSFISLRTVAPDLRRLSAPGAELVVLVKPQFEAGRARVGKGGIVRDPAVHAAVLREVVTGLEAAGLAVDALAPSSLRGADGNVEFFAHALAAPATRPASTVVDEAAIARVVARAHGTTA